MVHSLSVYIALFILRMYWWFGDSLVKLNIYSFLSEASHDGRLGVYIVK